MIVALIGPSCSGKSYYLRWLHEYMGFEIPVGITTRPERKGGDSLLNHISKGDFESLLEAKKLCFVDEAFDHLYAYPIPLVATESNVAVEIRRNNILELRDMGGYLLKILPYSFQAGLERIQAERSGSIADRIHELQSEFCLENEPGFDAIFRNRFDQESVICFSTVIDVFINAQ